MNKIVTSGLTPDIERAAVDYHTRHDPHRRASGLSDIILGGQDGLVNVLGVILGVAAATSDTQIVMVAGLAATVAESISMGAVAYTSRLAESAFYESERAREYRISRGCQSWSARKSTKSTSRRLQ